MNATRHVAWLIFAFVALAGSHWYVVSSEKIIKLDASTLANTADVILSELNVDQFDTQGLLINHLFTPQMRHIPEQNTNVFLLPNIQLTPANHDYITINSKSARAVNGSEQITFTGQVVIHQFGAPSGKPNRLITEKLVYFTAKKIATTAAPVTFIQDNIVVKSIGMRAYLTEKKVNLISRVQATYQPIKVP